MSNKSKIQNIMKTRQKLKQSILGEMSKNIGKTIKRVNVTSEEKYARFSRHQRLEIVGVAWSIHDKPMYRTTHLDAKDRTIAVNADDCVIVDDVPNSWDDVIAAVFPATDKYTSQELYVMDGIAEEDGAKFCNKCKSYVCFCGGHVDETIAETLLLSYDSMAEILGVKQNRK